ncbi:hypothetical protein DL766_003233 [Monosporascus sp. MC13-8B]|uniref:RNase MRP protein 1 RNA binding domain-containing protein n=1 Tax=Monosporascus cannonballus TaxID=155416 RepID=A0ABY0H1G5_9PEZI|nr:hypothetical protein DL762_007711 [Monosporascus cannonballus]RYO92502.1 hypothetical protein DL763_004631 [Monosporascus cannonballus]RYP33961.1 hypothetical protein DL766_003233 [Monosporascus sp. MC13-8B]
MATLKTAAAPSTGDAGGGNSTGNGTSGGPGDDANRYLSALDELLPLQPVLAGFNHRNRNQHRGARWWGAFGMLRRHVGKLADELDVAAARFARMLPSSSGANAKAGTSNSSSNKKKRKRDGETAGVTTTPPFARADERAKWLRDALVPKCYLAFSQLAADNQFATLGVVLLGVLAQVHAACTRLVGEAAEPALAPLAEAVSASSFGTPTTALGPSAVISRSNPGLATVAGKEPGGTVVSRAEVARVEKRRRKQQQEEGSASQPPRPSRPSEDTAGSTPIVVMTREGKERARDAEERPRLPAQKKATKKKTKKGDEFDNLFKSLF